MTKEEKQELYENICNDINCGTYILAPQYVDKLLAKLERKIASIRGSHSVDAKKLNARTEQVERLKREVLEVRQHLDLTEREWAKDMSKMIHYKTQSTKAKEIIREFVEWATWQGSNCPNFKSIQDKAEQFLKENEE